jgi:hypothetical protein
VETPEELHRWLKSYIEKWKELTKAKNMARKRSPVTTTEAVSAAIPTDIAPTETDAPTTEATPTPIDTPQAKETPTSNNGQQPDNFLQQILDASGMDLGEIAIAYGREEDQGLSDAELRTKWRPRIQNYMKNLDRIAVAKFRQLMKVVGADIVLKYSVVDRNEILVK